MPAQPPASLAPEPTEAVPVQKAQSDASSASIGRRVVSGGAWTMLGEVARFVSALIATHFITRLLDTASYSAWSLVARVGSSLSFADAGVGVASTKYVSEAHGRGDAEGERRALWASLLVGLVPSVVVALLMLPLAPWLVHRFFFETPSHLQGPMIIAFQVTAVAFVLRTVTAVFNSPLLARMRLDLNTLIFYGGIVAQIALVPFALQAGGIAWGASVAVVVWIATGAAYVILTARLLPGSLRPILDRELLKPIARMGVGTLGMALAAQALNSADFLIVGRLRFDDTGYYNLAFTASSMLSILPAAASQALLPAFSRLLALDDARELQALAHRAMRASCLVLPPIVALMCVAARPFFERWAPATYAEHATPVFLCFIGGLALNVLLAVPSTLLVAMGRTGTTARIGLFELVPFVLYTWALTSTYGIVGAALGRSLHFAIVCAVIFPLTARIAKIGFSPRLKLAPFALALACVAAPIALALWPYAPLWVQGVAAVAGVALYAAIVHARILEPGERALVARKLKQLSARFEK